MDSNSLTGLLALAAKNTQAGKAATMALKGLGSLVGCSGGSGAMAAQREELYPEGEQMCLIAGSTPIQVRLAEPMIEGQQTIRAEMPDGSIRLVDVPYLKPWNQCFGAR